MFGSGVPGGLPSFDLFGSAYFLALSPELQEHVRTSGKLFYSEQELKDYLDKKDLKK